VLAPGDRKQFAKHCSRLAKELGPSEQVTNVASCMSGKPGVLALTGERILFANKPDAITPMHVGEWRASDLESAYADAPDHLLIKPHDGKLLGFKALDPAVAQVIAETIWTLQGETKVERRYVASLRNGSGPTRNWTSSLRRSVTSAVGLRLQW
jgi:hypothetical protein